MNKKIIVSLLSVLILAGCASNNVDKNGSSTTTVAGSSVSGEKNPETVYIPEIPETGVPEIPDQQIIYSDTEVVIVVDPEGSSYANGSPILRDDAANIIVNQNQNKLTSTTTKAPDITVAPPATTTTSTVAPPPIVTQTEETLSEGTYYIYDGEGTKDPDKEYVDIPILGKYKDTGDTELSITDITVFTNSRPGVSGLQSFKRGDTLIFNILCNPDAKFDASLYIVGEDTPHKSSYSKDEYAAKFDLISAMTSSDNLLVLDFEIPKGLISGVYEFRFTCGGEEGYISFHIA